MEREEITNIKDCGHMQKGVRLVDINKSYQDLNQYGIWDFVAQFHPNYEHCSSVTYSDDMQCIVDGDYWEEDSGAEIEYFQIADKLGLSRDKENVQASDKIIEYARKELIEANADCMERAIEGFIAYMKNEE